MQLKPIRVAITGAAGAIAYALLFRIANGDMFGKNQPMILHLLEIEDTRVQKALSGVIMELDDCAFPLLLQSVQFSNPLVGFKDVDVAILIGARPRGPGMERADLLLANAQIFLLQGKALNEVASKDVKVLVVGNPANTNCLICMKAAPSIPSSNFTCLLRLDYNRAVRLLATKLEQPVASIKNLAVWGNHSSSMYADYTYATANGSVVVDLITEEEWDQKVFIPTVANRGASIIEYRGSSSCASAAHAIIGHMRDWLYGTSSDEWVTMGVPSDGSYCIPTGIVFGFPVICSNREYTIVQGLNINNFSQSQVDKNVAELTSEYEAIKHLF